jgi:hypothetical protein
MCPLCQLPDLTPADYYAALAEKIEAGGWAIQGVIGDRLRAPFAYTVGLTLFGCPELVVTGLRHHRACALLDEIAEHSLHCNPPRPGERVRLDHGLQLEVVKLDHPDAHLLTAAALYGPDILALQLVWADDRGRWPWERGHRGGRGGQPVLGPRAGARSSPPTR